MRKYCYNQIEKIANDIELKANTDKTEYMSYNLNNDINMMSRNDHCIKQVNNFKYLGSSIGSTERDIQIRIAQDWSALNSMNTILKSIMSDNLKRNFFRSAIESILLYGSNTWTLTSILDKKLDGEYTRMNRDALNTLWRVHVINKDIYDIIPNSTVSIREQRLRFIGHCWISKSELVSDLLLWQSFHGQRPRGRPATHALIN